MIETKQLKSPTLGIMEGNLKACHLSTDDITRYMEPESGLVLAFTSLFEKAPKRWWQMVYQNTREADPKKREKAANLVDNIFKRERDLDWHLFYYNVSGAARESALLSQIELGLYPKEWWKPNRFNPWHPARQASINVGRAMIEIQNHDRISPHFLKYFPDDHGEPLNLVKLQCQAVFLQANQILNQRLLP